MALAWSMGANRNIILPVLLPSTACLWVNISGDLFWPFLFREPACSPMNCGPRFVSVPVKCTMLRILSLHAWCLLIAGTDSVVGAPLQGSWLPAQPHWHTRCAAGLPGCRVTTVLTAWLQRYQCADWVAAVSPLCWLQCHHCAGCSVTSVLTAWLQLHQCADCVAVVSPLCWLQCHLTVEHWPRPWHSLTHV